MRNLARDVVKNVSLGDTVGSMSTNPGEERAEVSQGVTVKGSKSTTGKVELGSTVVGKEGIGVLEESDEDEPVVNPKAND